MGQRVTTAWEFFISLSVNMEGGAFSLLLIATIFILNCQAQQCSIEQKSCKISKVNFISSYPAVVNLEDCRKRCINQKKCRYLSYFGGNHFAFRFVI